MVGCRWKIKNSNVNWKANVMSHTVYIAWCLLTDNYNRQNKKVTYSFKFIRSNHIVALHFYNQLRLNNQWLATGSKSETRKWTNNTAFKNIAQITTLNLVYHLPRSKILAINEVKHLEYIVTRNLTNSKMIITVNACDWSRSRPAPGMELI